MRADDALKYALTLFEERTEWAHSTVAVCDDDGHDIGYLDAALCEVEELAMQFGDPQRYSDGRRIKSRAEIQPGFITEHIWHPDPDQEKPRSWHGKLPSDPGVPCPGVYAVATGPTTQTISVRVMWSVLGGAEVTGP
ncbi:hypothetical protein [Mycolicibacterium sp. 624]|uniref:hypothetical protein n=1 Tax=Mycolicibacterium sp. 624 TaxID=3156314 RepID=UPI0033951178